MIYSQTVSWVPSDKIEGSSCENLTDCEANIVCYQLLYTPKMSGVITSYTTGFFADCDSGGTTIISNSSCVLTDNSDQRVACEDFSKVLFNASANSGNVNTSSVEKDTPIALHQVCFQLKAKSEVKILKDAITNITVGLDGMNGDESMTEFPDYVSYIVQNEEICNALESASDLVLNVDSKAHRVSELFWTLGAETGIGKYIVERSINGEDYVEIGELKDQAFNEHSMMYSFIDEYAIVGENTYRISYQNGARDTEFSNEVSINYRSESGMFKVFPNPTTDYLNILSSFPDQYYKVTLTDEAGKIILQEEIEKQGLKQIDLTKYPQGNYNVVIDLEEESFDYSIILVK